MVKMRWHTDFTQLTVKGLREVTFILLAGPNRVNKKTEPAENVSCLRGTRVCFCARVSSKTPAWTSARPRLREMHLTTAGSVLVLPGPWLRVAWTKTVVYLSPIRQRYIPCRERRSGIEGMIRLSPRAGQVPVKAELHGGRNVSSAGFQKDRRTKIFARAMETLIVACLIINCECSAKQPHLGKVFNIFSNPFKDHFIASQ